MRFLSFLTLLLISTISFAQNNVGIGTTTPDASAVLDLSANDKGILIPRLTSAQRVAIANPANGLMVFDTDVDCFHYYSSGTGAWVDLCSVNGGGGGGTDGINCWDTNGNGINDPAEDTNGDTFFNTEDCQGADGAVGAQGPTGPAGADGNDGNDGAAGAQGPAGTNGTDGNGIASTTDNGDGTFTITYDDGSTFTTSDLTGPQGPAGPAGSGGTITDVDVNTTGTIAVVTDAPATYTSTESVWTTLGNSGTNVTNNFIGTTDAIDFAVRTNGSEQLRVTSGGQVIVNNTTTNATDKLAVYHVNGVAVGGYSQNNTTSNSVGVYGVSTGAGVDNYGVYGFANGATANATSVFGLSDGNATGVGGVITSGTGYPGVWGFASPAFATGIIGTSEGSANVTRFHTSGSGGAFTASDIGIFAVNYNDLTGSVIVAQSYASGSGSATYNWDIGTISGGIVYKIIGDGIVSTIVEGETQDDRRVMFCPEAPEILFEDYGTGQLINGFAHIDIDYILSKNISVNEKHPLKVFIQLEGECNGVYVYNKSAQGFDVRELDNGNSSVSFSYHIVANRANDDKTNPKMVAEYEDARFPIAPKKDESIGKDGYKSLKPLKNKAH